MSLGDYLLEIAPVATTVLLGLVIFTVITYFSMATSNSTEKENHSSPQAKEVAQSASTSSSSSPSTRRREISVCPFSKESTFVLEAADHLDPTPLDQFDLEWDSENDDGPQKPPLGLRWLAAGISGQDQPGYLRAQLKRFRHHRHFLLNDFLFRDELAMKERIFREQYKEVFVMEPNSLEAQHETLELFMAYLPQRYPNIYQYNKGRNSITILPMAQEFFLKDYQDRPLELCARIVQEDLVLMRENTATTSYNMAAAAVVFSFNDLQQRLGTSTNFIHAPVPGFQEHLSKVLYLSFKNIKAEKPLWRNNWVICPSGRLDEPSDNVTHAQEIQALSTLDAKDRFLKVEYQTIRRLPRSNYLLFTIRTFVDPVSSLEQVPSQAAATLAASIRGMTSKTLEYRGIESEATRIAMLRYLDSLHTLE